MINDKKGLVKVNSEPEGADIIVDGEFKGKTPGVVRVERKDGKTIRVNKEGYENKDVILNAEVNATYVVGDIILGVFPLFIDASTGRWKEFSPSTISAKLDKRYVADSDATNVEPRSEAKDKVDVKRVGPPESSDTSSSAESSQKRVAPPAQPNANDTLPDRTPEVDNQIPDTKEDRPSDIAVVIGIRKYTNADVPNVDYAVRDAKVMKKYLTRTLGFREENVIYVENASGAAIERIFGTATDPTGQLHDWVKNHESSVFVYYSGHGAPNPESGNAYLLPSNANPSYISQNGYSLDQLYENLSKLPAESVTVALEACFSGTSEGGTVVQNASPAVLSVENPIMGMKDGLAFAAGATDQIASWYPEKKHGLFTYYFLKGLRGNADGNGDSAVTAKEMKSYLNEKVPYRAQRMYSRKQIPQVVGQNKDRVLVKYEGEVPAK